MKASNLISKKVYSINQGREIGYVLNLSFDEKISDLENFVICSLYEENEFVLKTEDVVSITNEALFVVSEESLVFESNFVSNNPIGKKVFSVKGENMGRVVDLEIEKGRVKKIICSICEILPRHVYSSGQDCLFFSNSRKRLKQLERKNPETKVKIQQIITPLKQSFEGQHLLGKVILKDILDDNLYTYHIESFVENYSNNTTLKTEKSNKVRILNI